MKCVLDDDPEGVCFSLEAIASTLRSMKETMSRMHGQLTTSADVKTVFHYTMLKKQYDKTAAISITEPLKPPGERD